MGSVLRAGPIPSNQNRQQSPEHCAPVSRMCRALALRPPNVLIRNRAVGAAVTALQQLEGAIQKAAARMEESSRGPSSLEVGPLSNHQKLGCMAVGLEGHGIVMPGAAAYCWAICHRSSLDIGICFCST